jgi:hypothetical protein
MRPTGGNTVLTSQLAAEQPSRVTELIRAADAARLARAARRTPVWPSQVAAALRESLRRHETSAAVRGGAAACCA